MKTKSILRLGIPALLFFPTANAAAWFGISILIAFLMNAVRVAALLIATNPVTTGVAVSAFVAKEIVFDEATNTVIEYVEISDRMDPDSPDDKPIWTSSDPCEIDIDGESIDIKEVKNELEQTNDEAESLLSDTDELLRRLEALGECRETSTDAEDTDTVRTPGSTGNARFGELSQAVFQPDRRTEYKLKNLNLAFRFKIPHEGKYFTSNLTLHSVAKVKFNSESYLRSRGLSPEDLIFAGLVTFDGDNDSDDSDRYRFLILAQRDGDSGIRYLLINMLQSFESAIEDYTDLFSIWDIPQFQADRDRRLLTFTASCGQSFDESISSFGFDLIHELLPKEVRKQIKAYTTHCG